MPEEGVKDVKKGGKAAKAAPHPLRAEIRSDAELKFMSSLGNLDDGHTPKKVPQKSEEKKGGNSKKKLAQLASGLKDE